MAPKPSLLASSHSLSSFPLSHPSKTLTPRKRPPISCRSPASTEPDGTGAAAPTRGDVFLDHLQSRSAAAVTLKHNKQNSTKKRAPSAKTSLAAACCYGCGAPLHTGETDALGYVDPDTYELKKRHRQLRTVLCGRCRLLSHGHMVSAVGGHGGYAGGKQFVTAEELREKLSHLRHEKALIVKLMLFDTPGVHLHHRQAAVVLAEDLPVLAPQNRLRGKSFPAISDKDTLSTKDVTNLNGYSLFWGGLVCLNVLMVLISQPPPCTFLGFSRSSELFPLMGSWANIYENTGSSRDTQGQQLTFYGPRKVQIHMVPTVEADEFY